MKAGRQSAASLALGCVALCVVNVFVCPARAAQTTVADETGLLSDPVVRQIDARNLQLFDATGTVVVVVVVPGRSSNDASLDMTAAAEKVAKGYYGSIIYVATEAQKTDIVFTGKALKWVSLDEQTALRHELAATIRFCCPGDTLPYIVDSVAGVMQAGSKRTPDDRNYVRDDIGLLNGEQTERIVVRDQRLESATGKGVAVILFTEPTNAPPGIVAQNIAQTLDVAGQVAAVVWVSKGATASHFAMIPSPELTSFAEATATSINQSFQADMQTGKFGDAIVAVVDRTAAAIQSTQTPTPAPTEPPNTVPLESESSHASQSTSAANRIFTLATVLLLLLAAVLIVILVRRSRTNELD